MAVNPCSNPIGGFVAASEVVVDQFAFFTNLVNEYLNNANEFSQILSDYEITPTPIQNITWDINTGFTPFVKPADPAGFVAPPKVYTGAVPVSPDIDGINTDGLDAIVPPILTAPTPFPITIPTAPTVVFPTAPGNGPTLGTVDIPTYTGGPLPLVPTLFDLNLPPEPDISLEDLNVDRPVFHEPTVLSDTYNADLVSFQNFLWSTIDGRVNATGVQDMHGRLQTMLAGGTGLPVNIELALFARAIGREDVSSIQAVAQAEAEWSAKGFSLPGSTLLARVQEIRQANRIERGRVNRELAIQFHTQEIENLRFSVEKAISLEGTLLEANTRILDTARQLADGHWVVAKGIYDSAISLFALYLEIYKTDVSVYKERIQIELAKLEVYRSQLEGQRLVGTLNQQLVDIYQAELQGVLANVEVFKAEVGGAEAALRAELTKVEVYKAQIEAYSARLGGEKLKYEIYDTTVGAEQVKAQVYTAQVDAYGKRIEAYRTEVGAEASKVDAYSKVAEAETRIYAEQVGAWRAGIQADTDNLNAFVEVYKSNLAKYTAILSAEQYRVTGEARNFELDIEQEKARVASVLKQADQAIEQLKHISQLGLAATDTAAKVNSQLASSAMAAISVSASMSSGNTVSAQDSRSCSTQYSATISA